MFKHLIRKLKPPSAVAVRKSISQADLAYTKNYAPPFKYELGLKYTYVNDTNRFESMKIIFDRLSGYAGRRQYKMQNDFHSLTERFQELGVDWQDLKAFSHPQLMKILQHVQVTKSQRLLLLSLLDVKICGVLTRGSSGRDPQTICYREGKLEHGWRCGKAGHTDGVYFEQKRGAGTAVTLYRRNEIVRRLENGVSVEVREAPDFSIVGRLAHETHPRVWSQPHDPVYHITCIGYEFRVNPQDPRAKPQIADAAAEWETHAQVIQNVIWELIEIHGVPRAPQKLDISPGEFTPEQDEDLFQNTRMFNSVLETGEVIERRMAPKKTDDDEADQYSLPGQEPHEGIGQRKAAKKDLPWMLPPQPQQFNADGTLPEFLPFSPTIVIRSALKPISEPGEELTSEEIERRLLHPLLDISMLLHPDACFWFPKEDEEKCLKYILSYAKKVPFGLPFNLYFRVDLSGQQEDKGFVEQRETQLEEKKSYFDLKSFCQRTGMVNSGAESTPNPMEGTEQGGAGCVQDKRAASSSVGVVEDIEIKSFDVNPEGWE